MNEQKEGHAQTPDSGPDLESQGEAEGERSPAKLQDTPQSSNNTSSGRGHMVVAWLALLLALAAGGLAGWQWWLLETSDDTAAQVARIDEQASAIETQARRIDQLDDQLDDHLGAVDARIEDLAGQLDSRDFDPDALGRRIRSLADSNAEFQQQVNALSQRLDEAVSGLESQVEQAGTERSVQIENAVADARFRLGLMEVAALLRLGQSRAEFAADPAGAAAAYRQAQSRLEAIEDGRVEQLRQLVARELESLRSVDTPDWSALAGQLSALEADAAHWPLAGSGEPAGGERPAPAADDAEEGWWSSLKNSVDSLVRVTPREAAPLTSAAVESVRERLRLHLAAAQAAAARRNTDEMARQLDIAGGLIQTHFDTAAQAVSRALETITEAASAENPSLPDLGTALAEAERRMAAS